MGHDAIGTPSLWPELDALVTELISAHRAVAQAQAHEARLLSAAIDLVMSRASLLTEPGRHSSADMALREVSAEVGTALRLSDHAVQRRMGDAAMLMSDYPATLAMWERGAIDGGHVAAILDAGTGIDDATLRVPDSNSTCSKPRKPRPLDACRASRARSPHGWILRVPQTGCGGHAPSARCASSTFPTTWLASWQTCPPCWRTQSATA